METANEVAVSKSIENWAKRRIRLSRAHQELIFSYGLNELTVARRWDRHVELPDGTELTEFVSCSYLGLETDPRLSEAAAQAARHYGVQFASARTRMRAHPAQEYEAMLGQIFRGHTVTFCAVSNAHLGLFPLIGSGELPSYPTSPEGICWILDQSAHASMQVMRGILEQFGPVIRIPFERLQDVSEAFKMAQERRLTPISVSDSIGSMGGLLPVGPLLELAERHSGYVYMDDAHGTSIMGEDGCGYALHSIKGKLHPRLILLSSLSKAFGATGGAVTLHTEEDANFVRRFCTTYIFGGPLSLPGVAAGVASARIHLSPEIAELQRKLWSNVALLDKLLGPELGNHGLSSPIRFVKVGDEKRAIDVAMRVRKHGFALTTAMFPTVKKGEAILRIALSAAHRPEELEALSEAVRHSMATTELQ